MDAHFNCQAQRRVRWERRRRALAWLLAAAAVALLLAGCGVSTSPGAPTGKLAGQVIAGPTCGAQPVDKPCPVAPVPHRQIAIDTPDGRLFETISTDAAGHFSATLPAGSYVLRVAIQRGALGMRQVTPGAITIVAGKTTTVTIELDTGIR